MGEMVQLQVDQGLATITINRPERMNALTPQMIVDLTDIARDLVGDPECRVVAIRHAATRLDQPRLDGCTLWVTLEPCAMCAAAIALSRIEAIRFGAEDPKGGGVVNGPRIFSQPTCHHRPDVLGGIGEQEAAAQLKGFFEARRA